eukprot:TRINITY_DN8172_c0_g1_i5.p1 TRINITY_DN8172_c0_g1~~TRINITY_DN8172_c0_g1_i5.p1  ORF type:complete len:1732 (-),score=326.42 TRINITY_DN8172_c0_g1_i5:97-5292(-)
MFRLYSSTFLDDDAPKFQIKCTLFGGEELFEASTRWTVDQVKTHLFKNVPVLFAASRGDFYLGLNEDELLTTEFEKLSTYNKAIQKQIKKKEPVELYLFPAQILYRKSFLHNSPVTPSLERKGSKGVMIAAMVEKNEIECRKLTAEKPQLPSKRRGNSLKDSSNGDDDTEGDDGGDNDDNDAGSDSNSDEEEEEVEKVIFQRPRSSVFDIKTVSQMLSPRLASDGSLPTNGFSPRLASDGSLPTNGVVNNKEVQTDGEIERNEQDNSAEISTEILTSEEAQIPTPRRTEELDSKATESQKSNKEPDISKEPDSESTKASPRLEQPAEPIAPPTEQTTEGQPEQLSPKATESTIEQTEKATAIPPEASVEQSESQELPKSNSLPNLAEVDTQTIQDDSPIASPRKRSTCIVRPELPLNSLRKSSESLQRRTTRINMSTNEIKVLLDEEKRNSDGEGDNQKNAIRNVSSSPDRKTFLAASHRSTSTSAILPQPINARPAVASALSLSGETKMDRLSNARMSKEIMRDSAVYSSLSSLIPSSISASAETKQQGWLTKQGDTFKTWNRRWCVMKDGFIVYYKTKTDKQPIGWLPLQNCLRVEVDNSKKNGFLVFTPHRVYHLIADSPEERVCWMNALSQTIRSTTNSVVLDSSLSNRLPKKKLLSSVSYDNSEKEGYLTKMGGSYKSWKKRWCVLKDMFIYYFKTKKDTTPLGSIPLQEASIEVVEESSFGKKNCFQIHTRYRTYFLVASDGKEFKDWMEFIARSIASTQAKALKDQQLKTLGKIHTSVLGAITREVSAAPNYDNLVVENRMIPNTPPVGTSTYANDKMVAKQIRQVFNIVNHEYQDNEESNYFRYAMSKLIEKKAGKGLNLSIALSSTTPAPPPSTMPVQFLAKFTFIGFDYKKTIPCTVDLTIRDAIAMLLKRARSNPEDSNETSQETQTLSLLSAKPTDFVVKIPGTCEYVLDGSTKVGSLTYVRECLSKAKPIELKMVLRKTLPDNIEEELNKTDMYIVQENELDIEMKPYQCYCSSEVKSIYELKVLCVENIEENFLLEFCKLRNELTNFTFYIQCGIYYAGKRISNLMRTEKIANSYWGSTLKSNMEISELPREARLCFTLYGRHGQKDHPLGWANIQIFDYAGAMRSGYHQLRMWRREKANPVGTCDNCFEEGALLLNLEFMKPPLPICFFPIPAAVGTSKISMPEDEATINKLERLLSADPLEEFSVEDRQLLWTYKTFYLVTRPECLPKILLATPWTNPFEVQEAYRNLNDVKLLPPIVAFELLDSNFMDAKVREFAVKCIEVLTDEELVDYMLQLVQVLKYEPYHNNALARFLIQRALRNRLLVGHTFFWHLQAEMHVPQIHHRYGLYMEAYLRGAGEHRVELLKQMELGSNLRHIATIVKETAKTQRATTALHTELSRLLFTSAAFLSLNPKIKVSGLLINKCKYMDSATFPLWLVFKNVDPEEEPISVIFKTGDDLRQDVLTLQMLTIMDKLWKQEGLDMHITAYGCVATGKEMGMIQVVPNSQTTATIEKDASGAAGALKKKPLFKWLKRYNPTEQAWAKVIENFTYSLAGYCVATYILGIGDRHNDNIMCTQNGHLFHIDFAHFLGNVLKFARIVNRDKAPFVLTNQFLYVFAEKELTKSPQFTQFVDLCCKAYNILRKHANLFITLFTMMLSTGIPQLKKPEDLHYLREAFCLQKTDEEAAVVFADKIMESLNTKMTQLNNFVHNLAHAD